MRKYIVSIIILLLLLIALPLAASGETITADGIRYTLDGQAATIMGIEEGVTEITILPEFQGLPTAMADEIDAGSLQTLIFGEGITDITAYQPLLKNPIKRVELPTTLQVPKGDDVWDHSWINDLSRVEALMLPANCDAASIGDLAKRLYLLYWDSAYTIMFASWDAEMGYYDNENPLDSQRHRTLRWIGIAQDNPWLYDIDGVVFEKGTDRLLLCPIARSGAYEVPMGTRSIGPKAFLGCDQLESIALPRSVTTIETRAFEECASLRTINLPPTLQLIESRAFLNCVSLASIVLPNGITIEDGAFDCCTGLRAIYCNGENMNIHKDAFWRCMRPLALYAPLHSGGYDAAGENELLWAEIGGVPVRLPNPNHPHQRPAVIHLPYETDTLTLYQQPDEAAQALGQYPVGTTVDILDDEDGWAHVSLCQSEGYMPLSGLLPQSEKNVLSRILEVGGTSSVITLYEGPSMDAPKTTIESWDSMRVIQRFGIWYVVETEAGPRYCLVQDSIPIAMSLYDFFIGVVASDSPYQRAILYSEPDTKSTPLGAAYNGAQVKIQRSVNKENEGFERVQIGETVGYIKTEQIKYVRSITYYYAE